MARAENDSSHSLFTSSKSNWKRMRTIMNPTFSSAKLRELGPLLITCTERLVDVLEKENNKEVDITRYLKRFTMDSIWNCAFGVDINLQYNTENEYLNKCEAIFTNTTRLSLPAFLGTYFHEFRVQILSCLIFINSILSKFNDMNKLNPFFGLNVKLLKLLIKENQKRFLTIIFFAVYFVIGFILN